VPRVGVLALQGDFAAHARALIAAGAEPREVRRPAELCGLRGLVLPGGESTAWLRLMEPLGMPGAIAEFHRNGGVLFGTCAGLILLAREVTNPEQESLGLLDVAVERNGYGRQVDSFAARGTLSLPGRDEEETEMIFIRAPRIRRVGPGVRVLGRLGAEPVCVAGEGVLATAFHPEMSEPPPGGGALHRYFLEQVRTAERDEAQDPGPARATFPDAAAGRIG
jgi:5'-phosphate synthase pdxT subunit